MLMPAVLSVVGLLILTMAADHLILGSGRLAERLRIEPVVIGVVIIGFGTSAPELVVAGAAAAHGHMDLAVASLVGSNIINLTLILGIGGLVAALTVRSTILRREAPLSLAAVAVFGIALLYGLGPFTGGVLAISLIAAMVLLLRFARQAPKDVLAAETGDFIHAAVRPRLMLELVRTVLGLAGTLAGAQLLVVNASELALGMGIPADVVGFTLVALGTSLPELVTSIQAQRRGDGDLLVGNLLGSNLINSLAGGLVIALTSGGSSFIMAPALVVAMVGVSGITWALLARGQRLTRGESAALLGLYLLILPLIT